uniref:Uncharacterized protein n=1 Tax=Romanomermis culicivorax TaxID=13658 RepID=A0A915HPM2_ROMCU
MGTSQPIGGLTDASPLGVEETTLATLPLFIRDDGEELELLGELLFALFKIEARRRAAVSTVILSDRRSGRRSAVLLLHDIAVGSIVLLLLSVNDGLILARIAAAVRFYARLEEVLTLIELGQWKKRDYSYQHKRQ